MIYILLFLLFLLLLIEYNINGKNILSAGLISICMYIISTATVVIYMDYFQYEITSKTVWIIILSLILLCIGEAIFLKASKKKSANLEMKHNKEKPIHISYVSLAIIIIFSLTVDYFCFKNLFSALGNTGVYGNIFEQFESARSFLVYAGENYSKGILLSQACVITECLSLFCFFAYSYNRIYHRIKSTYYLIPIALYVLQLLSSTGRTGYIGLITVACIIIFVFQKDKTNWSRENDKKIIKYSIEAILIFLLIFRISGYITGTSHLSSISENIVKYVGSSIIGLDVFLNSSYTLNSLESSETLRNLLLFLKQFGFNISYYSSHLEKFSYENGISNVYTGLRSSIKDYTLLGMLISRFMLGNFYGILLRKLRDNKRDMRERAVGIILVGLLFYPIVMTAIADTYKTILSSTFLYQIVYLYLINWYFIKRRGTRRKQALR